VVIGGAAASSAKAWPLSLSAIGKTRSRQAAAPWAEGLRPIPNSQPENKNSPRQLESEAGLTHGTPRPVGILGAAVLPQLENHIGQQQCVALILRHTIFRKRGFSQINVTTRRRPTSSTGAREHPPKGSQEKTHAPVAAYIAMTAGTNTVSWINMAGLSSKVEASQPGGRERIVGAGLGVNAQVPIFFKWRQDDSSQLWRRNNSIS
jgi:hypothetical protein